MPNNKIRVAVRKYEPFEIALDKMWRQFSESTKCNLSLEAIPMDLHDLYESILGEKQGLKNGDWDIAYINTDWLAEAYENNAISSLKDFIKRSPPEGFPEAWASSLLEAQRFGDDILGLPFHNGPECLIYRKDLFNDEVEKKAYMEKTGNPLVPPATWNEFQQVAQFFHRPKDNLYGTVVAAFPDGHNTVFDFCIQLWSRGGTLLDNDGMVKIDSPEAIEGLQFYCDLLTDSSVIHPKSFELDSVKSGDVFASGEASMMVNWFGFASMCEVVHTSKVKGNVAVTNIPKSENGVSISLNAYWMYCIGAGSRVKNTAYDFISYATNSEKDKLLTLEGGIGCRKSTWRDKEVNDVIPYYSKLEKLHANTRMLPRNTNWFKISQVIDRAVLQAIENKGMIETILQEKQSEIKSIT